MPFISDPLQYDNGLRTYAINILVVQMAVLGRASHMTAGFMSQVIPQATPVKVYLPASSGA